MKRIEANMRLALCVLLLAVFAAGTSSAKPVDYTFEIPPGRSVTYEMEFELIHPGTVRIHADWTGRRILSLRFESGSDSTASVRRSGPAPQDLEVEIGEDAIGAWTLTLHSITATDSGQGTLRVELPGPPGTEIVPDSPKAEPIDETADTEPWLRARPVPPGIAADKLQLIRATDAFRLDILDADDRVAVDACGWQSDLLRFLAESRDALLDEQTPPEETTREMLLKIAATIELVEGLRGSDDPVLVGPPPDDSRDRKTWLHLHNTRIQELEAELDELLDALLRGHAPPLSREKWPMRLVSCITACERHFEERSRVDENRAANGELARLQWKPILAAAQALRALAIVGGL